MHDSSSAFAVYAYAQGGQASSVVENRDQGGAFLGKDKKIMSICIHDHLTKLGIEYLDDKGERVPFLFAKQFDDPNAFSMHLNNLTRALPHFNCLKEVSVIMSNESWVQACHSSLIAFLCRAQEQVPLLNLGGLFSLRLGLDRILDQIKACSYVHIKETNMGIYLITYEPKEEQKLLCKAYVLHRNEDLDFLLNGLKKKVSEMIQLKALRVKLSDQNARRLGSTINELIELFKKKLNLNCIPLV